MSENLWTDRENQWSEAWDAKEYGYTYIDIG